MNNRDKMVEGVKVKRVGYMHNMNWEYACKNNGINIDSVLTISSCTKDCVLFDELTGYKRYIWCKEYFEIVEDSNGEPKTVNKPTEIKELLKQIKTSIEVTEDARKAYEVAKTKSLELSKLLQQKLSNTSH